MGERGPGVWRGMRLEVGEGCWVRRPPPPSSCSLRSRFHLSYSYSFLPNSFLPRRPQEGCLRARRVTFLTVYSLPGCSNPWWPSRCLREGLFSGFKCGLRGSSAGVASGSAMGVCGAVGVWMLMGVENHRLLWGCGRLGSYWPRG